MGTVYDVPVTSDSESSVEANGLYIGRFAFGEEQRDLYVGSSISGVKVVAGRYYAADASHPQSFGIGVAAQYPGTCYFVVGSYRVQPLTYNDAQDIYRTSAGFNGLTRIISTPLDLYDGSENELNTNGIPDLLEAVGVSPKGYPVFYNSSGCTVTGPATAPSGTDVVITVTPDSGYSFSNSGVTVVDRDGVRVPFITQGNNIVFTMPYPP